MNILAKNFLYNAAFQILLLLVPLITTPYVSRVLGPANIGIASFTSSITSYFILFATFGFNMYGQREIAYCAGDKTRQSTVFWEVMLNKGVSFGLAAVFYLCFLCYTTDYRIYLALQGINLVSCVFDISWFFQGIQDFKKIVTRNLVIKLAGTAGIFLLIRSEEDLWLYIALSAVIGLLGNLSLWLYMPRYLTKVSWHDLRPLRDLRIKLELFAPYVAIQVYTVLDKTMLGVVVGDNLQNGYYEQSQRVIQMALAILTSLGTVLIPNMAEKFARHDFAGIRRVSAKAFHFILMFACPMTCGLMAIAPFFVPWFFGPGYDGVIILLQLLASLFIIIALSNIAGCGLLTPMNRQNYGTLAVIIGALLNFVLNLYLIPRYAALGASIATLAAELAVTAIHLYYVRQYVEMRSLLLWLIKYMAPALLMGGSVYWSGLAMQQAQVPGILISLVQIMLGFILYAGFVSFVYREYHQIRSILHR